MEFITSVAVILLTMCTPVLVSSSQVNNSTLSCKQCTLSTMTSDRVCELENPLIYHPCRCDRDCEVYRDCCQTAHEMCFNKSRPKDEDRPFQCQNVFLGERDGYSSLPGISEQYWMVSVCLDGWRENNGNRVDMRVVEENCNDGPLHLPPVTDAITGLVYRNEFCAICNKVDNLTTWDVGFTCKPELKDLLNDVNYTLTADEFNLHCEIIIFLPPSVTTSHPVVAPRQCYPQIETCLELDLLLDMTMDGNTVWNSSYYDHLNYLCTESLFQNIVVQKGQEDTLPFRNEYCALCNNVDRESITCFEPPDGIRFGSFTIVLDVYGSGVSISTFSSETRTVRVYCSEATEIFDPVLGQCRSTLQNEMERCNISSEFTESFNNCTECAGELIVLIDSTMYTFTDTNTLLYNDEQYVVESNTSNGAPVVCVNFSTNGTRTVTIDSRRFIYPLAYVVLTYIGCPVSLFGCIMIILTYALFKELRNLPGQILMQLAISILIGDLLIIVGGPIVERIRNADVLCTPVAVLTHYVFLAQFTWMSIMSTEIARNLYRASRMKAKNSKSYNLKILLTYVLTGWCIPLLIVLIAVIVNFTTTDLVLYGELEDGTQGRCWINHAASVFVSFVTPLAISLIYNTTLFVFITIYLCKSARSRSKLNVDKKGSVSFLRLNVAVFSVSGITWLFGFLALAPRFQWAWIPYIILNSTQGFVAFVSFTCTKRVARLYMSLVFHQKEAK